MSYTDSFSLGRQLEVSGEELQEWLATTSDLLKQHVDSLAEQPSWNTENVDSILSGMDLSVSSHGKSFQAVVNQLFEEIIPCSFNTAGPGYLAYVPGGGVVHSAIADLISNVTNRYVGVWAAAPILATIESTVIRWFCNLFDYPDSSGGFLTSGGSLANWTALVTARVKLLGEDFLDGVIYATDQTHHCVFKAARLSGIPKRNLRLISTDRHFRMRTEELAEAVCKDRESGLRPFFVAANGGSTNTGSVDPLREIGGFCRAEKIWMHVDAAYGGFFILTESGRQLLDGIEMSDSIALDPHKGLFLPYGTGSLLVRQQNDLKDAHQIDADYMPARQVQPDRMDFNEISPELSRDNRGLRVWLPLQLCGTAAFQANLEEKLALTAWMHGQLEILSSQIDGEIEFPAVPQLSILAFRWRPNLAFEPGYARSTENARGDDVDRSPKKNQVESDVDAWNQQLLERINSKKRVYLSSTRIRNQFVLRICVLSFRTHIGEMAECLEMIRQSINELALQVENGIQ